MTLVDSLDTLWLMGMKEEFYDAMKWVKDELRFDYQKNKPVLTIFSKIDFFEIV